MAINKIKKQDILKSYIDDINSSECIFFINTSGLNVKIIDEFRLKLKSLNNTKYKLIKNTLFKLALSKNGIKTNTSEMIIGYNAVVFSKEDSNVIAKEIMKFSEDSNADINFGLLNLNIIDREEIQSLGKIPNKQFLISNLMYILNFNISKIVNALNYNTNLLVNSISLINDKKGGE